MTRAEFLSSRNVVHNVPHLGACWVWTGRINRNGYGYFVVKRKKVMAHKWAFQEWIGPIPHGFLVDHICRVRPCGRPKHLRLLTVRENTLIGVGPSAQAHAKTFCSNGHKLEGSNVYMDTSRGRKFRRCVTCKKRNSAVSRRRKAS